jgi:uncharacterized membrane protein
VVCLGLVALTAIRQPADQASLGLLVIAPTPTMVVATLLTEPSAAGLLAGVAALLRRDPSVPTPVWVGIGLAGVVLCATMLVADGRTGFLVGHVLVTVCWAVGALALLAKGISRLPLRIAGLTLVGAAVAKLVLFDLAALDGIARAAAFLGAGIALLAAGVRYAQLVSGRRSE